MSKLLAQYIEIYNILHIIPNTQKQPLKSNSLKSHSAISNEPTQLKFSGILRKHIKKKYYFLLKSQLQLKSMRLIWKLCFFHVAYNLGEFNWHTDRLSWQPGIGWLFCVCNVAMETGLFCLLPSNILYLFSLQ